MNESKYDSTDICRISNLAGFFRPKPQEENVEGLVDDGRKEFEFVGMREK
jgi:hypothetical protein